MNIKTSKIASLFIAWLAVLLFFPMVTAQAAATWTARYVSTTVNGYTVPSGYYEYLPSSYNSGSPLSTYSLVIFMHGSGQYGDGTSTGSPGLSNNLTDGLPKMIQNNTSPVAQSGGVFDTNNVIVLCPQCVNPYPISDAAWRSFYNFALSAYPKIDKRRICSPASATAPLRSRRR